MKKGEVLWLGCVWQAGILLLFGEQDDQVRRGTAFAGAAWYGSPRLLLGSCDSMGCCSGAFHGHLVPRVAQQIPQARLVVFTH